MKEIKHVVAQNPNVLELLWRQPNMYFYTDKFIWPRLLGARKQLLSKKLKHSYAGYAYAQLQRLQKP